MKSYTKVELIFMSQNWTALLLPCVNILTIYRLSPENLYTDLVCRMLLTEPEKRISHPITFSFITKQAAPRARIGQQGDKNANWQRKCTPVL